MCTQRSFNMDGILDLLFGGLKKIGPYVLKNILRNLFR